MTKPKFAVGDRVSFLPDRSHAHVRAGVYTIIRAMPITNAGYQYRVKNALDSHERVLDEDQLRPT